VNVGIKFRGRENKFRDRQEANEDQFWMDDTCCNCN